MPTYHWDIKQNTPEWHAIKAGVWSASKAAVIMGGLDTTGLDNLIKDIAWERVRGPLEGIGYKSAAMERGNELEPEARDAYAFDRDVTVLECGFVEHSTIPYVGYSPDGLLQKLKKGIEAKNPGHRAYMETLDKMVIPSQYRWQCRWAMWVGELEELDFIAYHPQQGAIVIPASVTDLEKKQMAERVALLEPKVQKYIDLLKRKAA